MRTLLAAALLLAASSLAHADKVTLTDGRVYEGVILEETDKGVKIKTPKATLTFPKAQVASVERGGSAFAEAEIKLAALDPVDPAEYLAVAKWLGTDGKSVADEGKMRKLCNIAAMLDRSLACEANLVLGRYLKEKNRPEAARAFVRAHNADAANAEASAASDELKAELETLGKRDLSTLAEGLHFILKGENEKAIPLLWRTRKALFTEAAPTYIKMTVEELAKDLQSRIACKVCNGRANGQCAPCAGKGMIPCATCDSKGTKKGWKGGDKDGSKFAQGVCRTCLGQGSVLCAACKAERSVTIQFRNPDSLGVVNSVTVKTTAVKWREEMRAELDLSKFISPKNQWNCTLVKALAVTTGGVRDCTACKGVKFAPPSAPPDVTAIGNYRNDILARIEGKVPFDFSPPPGEFYDIELVDDGQFRFRDGKWVE